MQTRNATVQVPRVHDTKVEQNHYGLMLVCVSLSDLMISRRPPSRGVTPRYVVAALQAGERDVYKAQGAAFEPLFGALSKRRQTRFLAEHGIGTHTTTSSETPRDTGSFVIRNFPDLHPGRGKVRNGELPRDKADGSVCTLQHCE